MSKMLTHLWQSFVSFGIPEREAEQFCLDLTASNRFFGRQARQRCREFLRKHQALIEAGAAAPLMRSEIDELRGLWGGGR